MTAILVIGSMERGSRFARRIRAFPPLDLDVVVKCLVALKSLEMGLQGHYILRRRAKRLDRRHRALIDGCEMPGVRKRTAFMAGAR